MRLSELEIKTIKNAVGDIDPEAEIYLFGSRADDSKKGGDIDLLIFSQQIDFRAKQTIRLQICEKIGEQKIDLVVAKDLMDKSANSPFVKIAHREGIKL